MNTNHTVVDLNKVSYANFYYKCATLYGDITRRTLPKIPTINGDSFNQNEQRIQTSNETMLEYAKRKNLLDTWVPACYLQLSNSHSLTYTGKKAISIWEAWRSKQFKKK